MQKLRGLHHGGLTRFHARPVALARPAHTRNRCLSVNAHASKPTKAQVAVVSNLPGLGHCMDSLATCVRGWATCWRQSYSAVFAERAPGLIRSPIHCFWLDHPCQLQLVDLLPGNLFVAAALPPPHHLCCCCCLSPVLHRRRQTPRSHPTLTPCAAHSCWAWVPVPWWRQSTWSANWCRRPTCRVSACWSTAAAAEQAVSSRQ